MNALVVMLTAASVLIFAVIGPANAEDNQQQEPVASPPAKETHSEWLVRMQTSYPQISPEILEKHGKPIPKHTPGPVFPKEAIGKATKGWVRAVLFVKADGTVASVAIANADPRGLFERSTIQALFHWTFEPYPVPWRAEQRVDFSQ